MEFSAPAETEFPFVFWVMLVEGENSITLYARAPDGERAETSFVVRYGEGVEEELRIQPSEATIPPGARQRLFVNADVEWEVSGGELRTDERGRTFFVSDSPGEFVVTATTVGGSKPRSVEATIVVRRPNPSFVDFEGVGGRIGGADASVPRGGVDREGRLWLPKGNGFFVWDPKRENWRVVGEAKGSRIHGVFPNGEGELVAVSEGAILQLDPHSGFWGIVEAIPPLPASSETQARIHMRPDGTIYRFPIGLDATPELWRLAPNREAWESVPLPENARPWAMAFDGTGGIYLAAKHGEETKVWHAAAPGERWIDTGPLPAPLEPIRDLLVDVQGRVLLAGHGLFEFDEESWEPRGSFPECEPGSETCGLFQLALRRDGSLLVVSQDELYVRDAEGFFDALDARVENPKDFPGFDGGFRSVLEGPEGTLFLRGSLGVYVRSPWEGSWSVLGEAGLPVDALANDLIVENDGTLLLASGSERGKFGHSLYRRDAGDRRWTGFASGCFSVPAEPVGEIHRDADGILYGLSDWYESDVCSHDPTTGKVRNFRLGERMWKALRGPIRALGVGGDGTLFVWGAERVEGRHLPVYRFDLRLGGWAEDSLPCASSFARTQDGTLWASCVVPYRRIESKWHRVEEGFPTEPVGMDGRLSVGDDGALLHVDPLKGIHRLLPDAKGWEPLGFGEPSMGARLVASGGGRTWAVAGDRLYELSLDTGTWVEVKTWLPFALSDARVLEASADGRLFISAGTAMTLFQSVHADAP